MEEEGRLVIPAPRPLLLGQLALVALLLVPLEPFQPILFSLRPKLLQLGMSHDVNCAVRRRMSRISVLFQVGTAETGRWGTE